jgi:hypothetical protein
MKRHDWQAIEMAYRVGMLSVREIARQHKLTEGAIRKRATKGAWERDLSEQVRQRVRAELVRSEVRTENAVHQVERQGSEASAATVVALVREHRSDIKRKRDLASTLYAQLAAAVGSRETFERLMIDSDVAMDTGGAADTASAARRAAMLQAVSLPQYIASLKDLSCPSRDLI